MIPVCPNLICFKDFVNKGNIERTNYLNICVYMLYFMYILCVCIHHSGIHV